MGYAEFDNIGAGHILSSNGRFDGFMASYTTAAGAYIDDDIGGLNDINIFPNPATEEIFIKTEEWTSDFRFRLINMLGTQVLSGKLHGGTNKVLLGNVSPGIYFISIESNGHSVVRKIMISG